MMPIVPALLGLAVVLVADGWLASAEVVGHVSAGCGRPAPWSA
jgi:hypothetical protein